MDVCRGCGGTGIDAGVTPRAAQAASMSILMRRTTGLITGGGTSNVCRINVSAESERGRMRFAGPLMLVHQHVEERLKNGYEIVDGERPDPALACQWCNGYGSPEGQLTVHALQKLAEN